jgi:DNA polymerase-3 subunit epsilon
MASDFLDRGLQAARRRWARMRMTRPEFAYLFDPEPHQEWVAIDTETTGLNVDTEEVIAIGAVRICGDRIMTSERFEILVRPEGRVSPGAVRVHRLREQDLLQGVTADQAVARLMGFIGSRPLVGYFLEFDVAMINKTLRRMIGIGLPQRRIEVSSMFYEHMNRQLPLHQQGGRIDLRFDTMMRALDLPTRDAHDATNDAVMAALAFIKLRHLLNH